MSCTPLCLRRPCPRHLRIWVSSKEICKKGMTTCNPCTVGGGIQTYLCKNGKPVRIELLRIRTPLIAGIFAKKENRFGLNPNRSLDFGEIARLCHAACFWPSRRRSGLHRGVARNRMRTEAGKMPGSLIFPIRNGHGVSNDRFGLKKRLFSLFLRHSVALVT